MQHVLESVTEKLCGAGGRALRVCLCGSWTKAGPSKQCSLISLSGLLTQTAGAKQLLSPHPVHSLERVTSLCTVSGSRQVGGTGWRKKNRRTKSPKLNKQKIWTVSLYKEGQNLCRGKTVISVCLSHNITQYYLVSMTTIIWPSLIWSRLYSGYYCAN